MNVRLEFIDYGEENYLHYPYGITDAIRLSNGKIVKLVKSGRYACIVKIGRVNQIVSKEMIKEILLTNE